MKINTARQINSAIDWAENHGEYLYIHYPLAVFRVIKAKSVHGMILVKSLTRKWFKVTPEADFESR